MSRTILVEASPCDASTGIVVPVRLAGGGSKPYTHLGHVDWRSGVMDLPRFQTALGFDDTGWTGGAVPQSAALVFMSGDPLLVSDLGNLYWKDAALTVKVGDDAPDAPTFALLMTATVAAIDVSDGRLTLTIGDMSVALSKPLLSTYFAGTGGIEGDDNAKNRIKRRSWGRVFNVEGFILDEANNIWEFGDPAHPLEEFEIVRDKGRAGDINLIAWQGTIDTTLAALIAAVPPQGGASVAPSIACVKWWTTPSGPLTADIRGEIGSAYVDRVGSIAERIVQSVTGPAIVDAAGADALRPYEVGIHFNDDSETIGSALDRLFFGVSLIWALGADGTIGISPWSFETGYSSPLWTGTGSGSPTWVYASGRSSPVWAYPDVDVELVESESVSRKASYAPMKTRRLGYQKNYRVQSDGEISAAILASDTFYPDGTKVSDLMPQEPAAQVSRNIDADQSAYAFTTTGGVASPGQLPFTFRAYVTAGAADVSILTDWSVTTTGGVTATINNTAGDANRGVVTITGITADGTIVIHATEGTAELQKTVTISTKGILADLSNVGTGDINAGSVAGILSYSGSDVVTTTSEGTIYESPSAFAIGDSVFGVALATISFVHDASAIKDAAFTIRVYVDLGDGAGYIKVIEQVQGIRANNGTDTYLAFPASFPIAVQSTHPIKVKVTQQSVAMSGGTNKDGIWLRNIRLTVIKGAR